MARVGWDQKRFRLAMLTTVGGHSLLALLSLLSALDAFHWQEVAVAIAIGMSATAVDLAWHREDLLPPLTVRIAAPLYRLTLIFGPVVITTLVLLHQLPSLYMAVYGSLALALPLLRSLSKTGTPLPTGIQSSSGVYAVFVGIMVMCRLYQ
jgi:hypothetical protein